MKRSQIFVHGLRDGIPISLGYFAVAFSLGIAACKVGFTAFQAGLASLLNNASAGEHAAFTNIGAGAGYWTIALITLVTNARYLLMSCALSQKLSPDTPLYARMIIGFDVTDEIFGVSMAQPGYIPPVYSYGVILMALPGWSLGTYFGVLMGNALPLRVVSALSVALYGMFIAVIIPPSRKDRFIAIMVVLAMLVSWLTTSLNLFAALPKGMDIIILTVVLAAVAAVIKPVKDETEGSAA